MAEEKINIGDLESNQDEQDMQDRGMGRKGEPRGQREDAVISKNA